MWKLSAEQEHAKAQFNLGVMYDAGEGVPQDDKEAVKWWRLAAEQGVAHAQANLGNMYELGGGVTPVYYTHLKLSTLWTAQLYDAASSYIAVM